MTSFLVMLGILHAQAQEVRLEPQQVGVQLATGYDRAVLPVSLTAVTSARLFDRPLALGATWTLPFAALDFGDHRIQTVAELDLNPKHGWMVRLNPSLSVTTTRNEAYGGTALGGDFGLTAGGSAPRWMAGAEFGMGGAAFTHLRTTEWARSHGGVPIERSWRYFSSATVRTGLRAAVFVAPVALGLRIGFDVQGKYAISPPVYARLSVGVHF